jgi:hypothetical protein
VTSTEPTSYALTILAAFSRRGVTVYPGTVSPAVKADRREKNRIARRSRRTNRRSA